MGMFDDIAVDYPLPTECPCKDFQSKDLDCNLDRYRITAQGRLIREYTANSKNTG